MSNELLKLGGGGLEDKTLWNYHCHLFSHTRLSIEDLCQGSQAIAVVVDFCGDWLTGHWNLWATNPPAEVDFAFASNYRNLPGDRGL